MKWKNNAKISAFLFILLTACSGEGAKESRWKRENAEGAYITRSSRDKYPLDITPVREDPPSYPWEK